MSGLVLCVESDDVLGNRLVDAARRRGIDVEVVDLRADRPSITIEDGRARVSIRGRCLRPQLVLNRTWISSLGMPSGAAVERRASLGSRDAGYVAAREEQGLMLAAFAVWTAMGSTIVNPVLAFDRYLQPELGRRRLIRAGMTAADGPSTIQVLVAGDTVIHGVHTGRAIELTEQEHTTAIRAGSELGLALGRIDILRSRGHAEQMPATGDGHAGGDGPAVTGWHPMPLRQARVSPSVVDAVAVALGFDELRAIRRVAAGSALFIPDIVANLRGAS